MFLLIIFSLFLYITETSVRATSVGPKGSSFINATLGPSQGQISTGFNTQLKSGNGVCAQGTGKGVRGHDVAVGGTCQSALRQHLRQCLWWYVQESLMIHVGGCNPRSWPLTWHWDSSSYEEERRLTATQPWRGRRCAENGTKLSWRLHYQRAF